MNTKRTTLYLPPEIEQAMKELAKHNSRSLNGEIVQACKRWVEQQAHAEPIKSLESAGTSAVLLARKYGQRSLEVQISAQDADLCDLHWSYATMENGAHFIHATYNEEHRYLARVILERVLARALTPQEQVNFVDGDTLNCRRENLRPAAHWQVGAHRGPQKNNTSGYKGVYWISKEGVWAAQITANKQITRLGRFQDKHEAARAYNAAALEYHGEFAFQNDVPASQVEQETSFRDYAESADSHAKTP